MSRQPSMIENFYYSKVCLSNNWQNQVSMYAGHESIRETRDRKGIIKRQEVEVEREGKRVKR